MFFKSNNKKKIRITHTFDKDVYEKFTELCEKNMTPRSTVLNENVRYMTKTKLPIYELLKRDLVHSK
tara:strand:+ start:291 stop:491 length:201 start_codon:yes stop_codon:yes gene_type:complete